MKVSPESTPHAARRTPHDGRNLPLVGPTCGRPRPTLQNPTDTRNASLPFPAPEPVLRAQKSFLSSFSPHLSTQKPPQSPLPPRQIARPAFLSTQNSRNTARFPLPTPAGRVCPSAPPGRPPAFTLPAQPTKGTPPVAIIPLADGFGFVGSLANRIKGHADYAVADGNILGLEGPEIQEPDATTTKPALKLVIVTGGKVEVQWKKSGFTGVRIEVDRGNGTWVFLDMDTKPHYTDETRPAPALPSSGNTAPSTSRATRSSGNGAIR